MIMMKIAWMAGLAAFSLVAMAAPEMSLGIRYCCGSSFELSEVEAFARGLLREAPEQFFSMLVVPRAKSESVLIGGSSERTASYCFSVASRLRKSLSHAYLLKTPIGAALHHWDSRSQSYRSVLINGTDLYARQFRSGRVAWIDAHHGAIARIWLVSKGTLNLEQSLTFAKEVVRELQVRDVAVYIRSDPYLWSPDSCSAYSVPLQWQADAPTDDRTISRETVFCKIQSEQYSEECITYRSQ